MRVALIDVGSNTARLLVADVAHGDVRPVLEQKDYLGLAAEILRHGRVRRRKLAEVAACVEEFAAAARSARAERLEVVVTAPGRQADGRPLVATLAEASRAPVRVLSGVEEGRLAFAGCVARLDDDRSVVAVCDVGGGSTEVAVGTPLLGAAWVRSVDLGSLRLTRARLDGDPPSPASLAAAREDARAAFAGLSPPSPDVAFAVGGSARAAARIAGRTLGPEELDGVVATLAGRRAAKVARAYGLDRDRAETLAAGALLLAEAARTLGVPFRVGRGGLREGAALALAARRDAVAA